MPAEAFPKAEEDPKAVDWAIPVELCWANSGLGIAEEAEDRCAVEEAPKVLDP